MREKRRIFAPQAWIQALFRLNEPFWRFWLLAYLYLLLPQVGHISVIKVNAAIASLWCISGWGGLQIRGKNPYASP